MELDTRDTIIADVDSTFSSLHARAFCHATEHLDRVKKAMTNALGEVELQLSKTEGHHGNPITIIEATISEQRAIDEFFGRFGEEDIEAIVDTLGMRIDSGCNLFLKLSKQEAFAGRSTLGSGDDVISVRLRARAFPAKCEVAEMTVRKYLDRLAESRRDHP